VQSFESGQNMPHPNRIAAMRLAIEVAGVRLVFDKSGRAVGVICQDADVDLSRDVPA
jgi:hypothetical protein